jgi:gamma-glutamylcyclotransferase (GGCT)/AIG2-like uncharacterized protein YtfP
MYYTLNENPPIKDKVKIAVYGTLKTGFGNWSHILMNNSRRLSNIKIPKLKMVSLGGFPGVVPGDREIEMEVFEISIPTLNRVDRLEGIPYLYRRYYSPIHDVYFYMFNRDTTGMEEISEWNY